MNSPTFSRACTPRKQHMEHDMLKLNRFTRRSLRRFIRGAVLIAAGLAVSSICTSPLIAASHIMSFNGQCYGPFLFGDRLVFILEDETLVSDGPLSRSKVENLRGWLVSARLGSAEQMKTSTRVAGPIYDLNGSISSIANSAGAVFTKEDEDTLSRKPFFAFRENGDLVKSVVVDDGKNWHDWLLQFGKQSATWQDLGTRRILPLLNPMSSEFFASQSRRYAVQLEKDGVVRIYDLQTSREIDDPWLSQVAARYLKQEDLQNGRPVLFDDMKFLVVFLELGYRVWRDGREEVFEDFTMNGKTMRREHHFLVFERPSQDAAVYEGNDSYGTLPIEVDGELQFLKTKFDDRLEMRDLQNNVTYKHVFTDDEKWITEISNITSMSNDPREQRVVCLSDIGLIGDFDKPKLSVIRAATWDYKRDQLTQYVVPVGELFELTANGYQPKKGLSIADAK